jgi:hypothetical protein
MNVSYHIMTAPAGRHEALALDKASFITGQVVTVHSGKTAG